MDETRDAHWLSIRVTRPYNDPSSVYVNWTVANGSMHPAGISNGDVIFAIDGEPTPSIEALNAVISRRQVGGVVQVDVVQRSGRRTVPMKLVALAELRVLTYESAGMPVTDRMRAFRRAWVGSHAEKMR